MVEMPASRFTAAANGTWKPSERFTGSAVDRPVRPPEEQSMTSTPSSFSALANTTVSSTSQPPAPSTLETRMNIGLCCRPALAHGARRGEREAHAAGAVAAILVVALVADRREELRQEIAVRAVDLDHVVARGVGALGRLAEFPDQVVDVGLPRADGGSSNPCRPAARRDRPPATSASPRRRVRAGPACRTTVACCPCGRNG